MTSGTLEGSSVNRAQVRYLHPNFSRRDCELGTVGQDCLKALFKALFVGPVYRNFLKVVLRP